MKNHLSGIVQPQEAGRGGTCRGTRGHGSPWHSSASPPFSGAGKWHQFASLHPPLSPQPPQSRRQQHPQPHGVHQGNGGQGWHRRRAGAAAPSEGTGETLLILSQNVGTEHLVTLWWEHHGSEPSKKLGTPMQKKVVYKTCAKSYFDHSLFWGGFFVLVFSPLHSYHQGCCSGLKVWKERSLNNYSSTVTVVWRNGCFTHYCVWVKLSESMGVINGVIP